MEPGLLAVVVVGVVLGVLIIGMVGMVRDRDRRIKKGTSAAVLEIESLFAPGRRHVVDYHHAQEMRRDESGEGDKLGRRVDEALRDRRR